MEVDGLEARRVCVCEYRIVERKKREEESSMRFHQRRLLSDCFEGINTRIDTAARSM